MPHTGYIQSELPLGYCYLYGIGTKKDMLVARKYFQSYFKKLSLDHDKRLYMSNNLIVDLDYLMGLTYYFEGSPDAKSHFEASLKNNTFFHSQRADLLYKLSSCYKEGKCGITIDSLKSANLYNEAVKYAFSEINENNIIL